VNFQFRTSYPNERAVRHNQTTMGDDERAARITRSADFVCVLEAPGNISNVGAVIRVVEAFALGSLLIVDPHGRMPAWPESRSGRSLALSSAGANKWVDVKVFGSTDECFDYLELNGFDSWVSSPHAKGECSRLTTLEEGDFTQPKVAVWFGNEGRGISDTAVCRAYGCFHVPMHGFVESLNLAVFAGIAIHHISTKRR
jgi:tRNA (guanosine-2'-O-)-methyltransferase